ncbi:hypothetical protein [Sphingobacterium sp.]|uniref:hypothetical protein n=1 Tax=Sphingobacterium sp. TaxID=341027 RepID=UPI00289DD89F|nr:hypothetical protein [Sphingobacterium sp.]
MKITLRFTLHLFFCPLLFFSCGPKPKIQFVDKNGKIHLLIRESERKFNSGLQKIIAHGSDTVVTIDGLGHQQIWTSLEDRNIDTTKVHSYLKKRNGNRVNIYTPNKKEEVKEHNNGEVNLTSIERRNTEGAKFV